MFRKLIISFISILLPILLFQGCTQGNEQNIQESVGDMAVKLSSTVFSDGEMIPKKYSCDAENISPPLEWSDIPDGTKSLALIVDDPDAPAGNWVHWILYNISADQDNLVEAVADVGEQGKNTSGKISYSGPCPPKGPAHRYFFKIFALEIVLDLEACATKNELERAMQGYILAQGQLMGKYQR
jgi:hypothetical protein